MYLHSAQMPKYFNWLPPQNNKIMFAELLRDTEFCDVSHNFSWQV